MVDQLIQFTLETHSSWGQTPPQIQVNNEVLTIPQGQNLVRLPRQDTDTLLIDFFSKKESDTIVDNDGKIVADTEWRIITMWCNDIRLETWFGNDAIYRPAYFSGFLEHNTTAPIEILAPFQFNFPGTIRWQWSGDFWEWYFHEKNKREVINFLDKDPDRVWKFRGSVESCDDLVHKIKDVLKL
jgi:hypothetical protein